jgi:hypothetical protein
VVVTEFESVRTSELDAPGPRARRAPTFCLKGRRRSLSAFSIGLNRTCSRPEAILGWFEDIAMSARAGVIFRSDARRKLCGKLIP